LEEHFPKTLEFIKTILPEQHRDLKTRQIKAGIQAGYDKMIKMSKKSLSVPLVYLVLLDTMRGPTFLRSIMSERDDMEFPADSGWSLNSSEDTEERPGNEKIWVDALRNEKDKTALHHYYYQIGFHRECVPADLKELSKAEPASLPGARRFDKS